MTSDLTASPDTQQRHPGASLPPQTRIGPLALAVADLDRRRDGWRHDGTRVRMASDPVDIAGLMAEIAGDEQPWQGLASGTRIGHMHLQIGDVDAARRFYVDTLGFEVQAEWHGALFV